MHWKFQLGDFPEAKYANFDDSPWKEVHLPHDWAFEKGFSADGPQKDKGGYASGGIGWYRKEFTLTAEEAKAHKLFVDFDAAYMNSEVWINDTYLGKRPYGYISFSYDITKYLKDVVTANKFLIHHTIMPLYVPQHDVLSKSFVTKTGSPEISDGQVSTIWVKQANLLLSYWHPSTAIRNLCCRTK